MSERGPVPRDSYLLSYQFFADFNFLNLGGVVCGFIDCHSKKYRRRSFPQDHTASGVRHGYFSGEDCSLRKRRAAGFESPIKPCLIFPGHIAGGRGLAVKTPVCETGNVSSNLPAHPKSFAGGVVKGYFHLIGRAGRKPAKEWKPWGRGRSPEAQDTASNAL